jgi:4-hydroxy-3-methylbut-2-en-1-yl diphosphate synthase IspG/GcpE
MKKEIFIDSVGIGGNHPVSIQSMTSTSTQDAQATLKQIEALKKAECDIYGAYSSAAAPGNGICAAGEETFSAIW